MGVQYSGDFSKTGIDLQTSREYNHGFVTEQTDKQCDMALRSDHQSISASYSWQRTEDSRLLLIYDRAYSWQTNRQDIYEPGLVPQTIDYFNDYEISTATAKYGFVTRGWEHKSGLEWGHANNASQVEKAGDIQRSNRNNYWTSAYYALSRQWNRWRMNLGLRYEYDYTKTLQDVVIRYEKTYHDLLPSVKVGYRVNDDLDLTCEVFREHRTNRTVDDTSRKNFFIARTTRFALAIATRQASGSIRLFAIFNCQREEVTILFFTVANGRKDKRVPHLGDSRTTCLLCDTASFKRNNTAIRKVYRHFLRVEHLAVFSLISFC